MNGRIYDPTIGRMLQADIVVQAPTFVLSYNRYAYVWNNPVSFIDPTGYTVQNPGVFGTSPGGGGGSSFDMPDFTSSDNDLNLNGGDGLKGKSADELMDLADQLEKINPDDLSEADQSLYNEIIDIVKEELIALGIGMIPGSGLLDAVKQIKNGDYVGAAISILSEIPFSKVLKSGSAVKNMVGRVSKAVENKKAHGNSKNSMKEQHVYEIRNIKTGVVVKTGVSGGKISKKGKSYRAESQRRKWGKDEFETTIIAQVPAGKGARQKALDIERNNANGLRPDNLNDPDYHMRP